MVNVKLEFALRLHGGSDLRGVAIDQKSGKAETHICVNTASPLPWPFTYLSSIAALSPLPVAAALPIPTPAECKTALHAALQTIDINLGVDVGQMANTAGHYWNGTRWVSGVSPLAFQFGFLLLLKSFNMFRPIEQNVVTGQGGLTPLTLDFLLLISP